MKTLLRVVRIPRALIRSLRFDPDPYGTADHTRPSGEDAMRQGSVIQGFQYPG